MREALREMIEAADLNALLRAVDGLCAARSWDELLDLADACDAPVGWSCRTGVCHQRETGLVAGTVDYDPEPLDRPPAGSVLLCCARPDGDVALDA